VRGRSLEIALLLIRRVRQMTVKRETHSRLSWLTAILVLLTLMLLGLPNRLLTQWTYALERGRLQADTDELALANQDLARVHEVSNAFRLVARVAQPGVVHIRVSADEATVERLAELEREERRMQDLLHEMANTEDQEQEDAADIAAFQKLLRELLEVRGEIEFLEAHSSPASASGIIFDDDGHILTNNHVVEGRSDIYVQLPDEREYKATLIGADPKTDLALIRIKASELHPLKFGNSDEVEVGDWAIAVGAPFGLSQSVTHGIISATGRNNVLTNQGIIYQNFLQTDAAINPGNSGGPLLNLRGEVIGVNTAIATNGDTYNAGIAFTIPSNMAVKIARQLKETGSVARGWLGITMGELTAADREIFGIEGRQGVLVDAVIEGAPADKAGVLVEDVILAVNRQPVSNMAELRGLIADVPPGERTTFDLVRGNERTAVTVKLGRRPTDQELANTRTMVRRARALEPLGVYGRTLLPDYADRLGYSADDRGVLILAHVDGEADPPSISPEELIVECNGQSVKTVNGLTRLIDVAKRGSLLKLAVVNADGEQRTIEHRLK
jgi:serine protease Do